MPASKLKAFHPGDVASVGSKGLRVELVYIQREDSGYFRRMFSVCKEDKKDVRKVLAIEEYDYDESQLQMDNFWVIVFPESEKRLESDRIDSKNATESNSEVYSEVHKFV